MECKFGHNHPPSCVTASIGNPTKPRGIRPVHCPDCPKANPLDKVSRYWKTYVGEAEINQVMRERPHHDCLSCN